jgi:hypothetical protein
MVFTPSALTANFVPVDPNEFANTVAPEYTDANIQKSMGAYAQSLNPYYQQAYQNLGSSAAGRTMASPYQRSGATQLESQRTGQIAGRQGELQSQQMQANMQERQYQQSYAGQQKQFQSSQEQALSQFNEQSRQFAAQLNQQGDMNEEQKKQWWAKFQEEQAMQAAQLGIQQAQLTGEYQDGTWNAGSRDANGNYTAGSWQAGTGPKTMTWQKYSGLADLISKGSLGSYDTSGNYQNPYADTAKYGSQYDLLRSIRPEQADQYSFASQFGSGMTPYQLSVWQASNPEGFKNAYSQKYGSTGVKRYVTATYPAPGQPGAYIRQYSDGNNEITYTP